MTPRIHEQADYGRDDPRYSWILDGIPMRYRRQEMEQIGWKYVRGDRRSGAYVTTNRHLAANFAERLGVDIISNGTHEAIGAYGLLCEVTLTAKD